MTPYVLLLNPDAVIADELGAAAGSLRPARCGGRGRTTGGRDGQPQIGFMVRRLPTPAPDFGSAIAQPGLAEQSGEPALSGLDWDIPSRPRVEQPAGAFLMMRRAVWQELGGFDEGFFPLWFEDVDFCRRIRDRGFVCIISRRLLRNIQADTRFRV